VTIRFLASRRNDVKSRLSPKKPEPLLFDHDRSASRGTMAPQELVVFKHQCALGDAPAYRLLERVQVEVMAELKTKSQAARSFADYAVHVDRADLPAGIEVLDLL
jgi:CRISPR-associated protein Csd2